MFSHAQRHVFLKQTLLARRICPASEFRFAKSCRPYAWTCRRVCGRSTTCLSTAIRARNYSVVAPIPQTEASEDVIVACRSNGEISLNIYHPSVKDDHVSPLILYLPTCGQHADKIFGVDDSKIIAALSAASNGTIVRVNYRAGEESRYPTPVHDVLAGYDYVKERFAAEPWTTRNGRVKRNHIQIGVCGQLLGGSLAAMLGLTESHLAQDRIAAAAINSSIVDWVFPETELSIADAMKASRQTKTDEANPRAAQPKRRSKTNSTSWKEFGLTDNAVNIENLQATRDLLFKQPANYFDSFASPVHFFRSSGALIPADPTIISDGEDPLTAILPTKPRKAHQNFPPSNSTLTIPDVRISGGSQSPLYDSNEEFVKLLRKSVVRTVSRRSNTQALLDRFDEEPLAEDDRLEAAIEEAERKIEYHLAEGVGLWGTEDERWLNEVFQVGQWFRKVLK